MARKILALVLAILMVVSTPISVLAAEGQTADASVSAENMTVEGTNGFGNIVSRAINEQQTESESASNSGYVVTGMEITDNKAIVTYGTIEDATLVVGIYTEDGMELLCSGTTQVSAEETVATVTIEGEIPEYFWASAYLLDNYDLSPLSNSFESPLYTKDMQDLLASSVDDYDEDRLLNLDDNPNSNFAVFSEETIILEEQEGINTVVSSDDSSSTYVIENADENITGLQQGDIFAYPYSEGEILIVKVESIKVKGTTATITGQDVELGEVFDYVKVEGSSIDADPIVDENTGSEGVTFEGLVAFDESEASLYGPIDGHFTKACEFSIDKKFVNTKNVEVKTTGSVQLKEDFNISIYVTLFQQYIYFKNEASIKLALSVSGEISTTPIQLPAINIPCGYGLAVGFNPELSFSASGELDFNLKIYSTIGFDFKNSKETEATFESLCAAPKVEWEVAKLEVEFEIKVDLVPNVSFLTDVAKASIKIPIGAKVTIEKSSPEVEGENKHLCNKCYDGEINGTLAGEAEIELLNCDNLFLNYQIAEGEFEIGEFYYSYDHNDFGWGLCPYRSTFVTVVVLDENKKPVKNISVQLANAEDVQILGVTGENGIASDYVSSGEYVINTPLGSFKGQTYVSVKDTARKYTVYLGKNPPDDGGGDNNDDGSGNGNGNNNGNDSPLGGVLGGINPDRITVAKVIDSGYCGGEYGGTNLSWALYSDGTLKISGSGEMADYRSFLESPFYHAEVDIKKVVVGNEVTTIGERAFMNCRSITSITLGNSIVDIDDYAFYSCESITGKLVIPNNVTRIGANAFASCNGITSVDFGDRISTIDYGAFDSCTGITSVNIPNSVTDIGACAFYHCTGITSVALSDSITEICLSTFGGCTGITSIKIPDSVNTIGDGAFQGCTSITSIKIPDSTITIGYDAFYGCYGITGNLVIPDGVTSIGSDAFNGCYGITGNLVIPNSVTELGNGVFQYCAGITSVVIGDGISNIGDYAFYDCDGITNIDFGSSVSNIGEYAFNDCDSLMSVEFGGDISIGEYAFENCDGLTSVDFGNGDTSIGPWAFHSCNNVIEVNFGSGVTTIELYAFEACTSIEGELVIPSGVKHIGNKAFSGCSSITGVTFLDGATQIGQDAFEYCSNISSVDFGNNVTRIKGGAFYNCNEITKIFIPGSVGYVESAFAFNYGLNSVVLGDGITSIWHNAFYDCSGLTSIYIPESVSNICDYAFMGCSSLTDVYYGGTESQWNSIEIGSPNGYLLDATIHYNSDGIHNALLSDNEVVVFSNESEDKLFAEEIETETFLEENEELIKEDLLEILVNNDTTGDYTENFEEAEISDEEYVDSFEEDWFDEESKDPFEEPPVEKRFEEEHEAADILKEEPLEEDDIDLSAIYGGEYDSTDFESYALMQATFSNLVPGQHYVLLSLKSLTAENPLSKENLIYINQATALDDGSLVFEFVDRENLDISYIMACGASNKNLQDAVITFPEMTTSKSPQLVNPYVVYDGVVLKEDTDYILLGDVVYQKSGQYSCFIRGIFEYAGLVECSYTVADCTIHTEEIEAAVEPTCTESGLTEGKHCIICGEVLVAQAVVSAKGHTVVIDESVAPTLTESGLTEGKHCSVCELVLVKQEIIPAIDPESIAGGYCGSEGDGSNLIWSLNKDGILTIRGNGAMADYVTYFYQPWRSYSFSINKVIIDEGVTYIGKYAFADCPMLTGELIIPDSVTSIGSHAFNSCDGITGKLVIPDGVTSIGDSAFAYCDGLTGELVIPQSVTDIGYGAFSGIKFSSVHVDSKNTAFLSEKGIVYDKQKTKIVFGLNTLTGKLVIPDGITIIGDYAFSNCDGISGKLVLPNSITTIGDYAFNSCDGISGKLIIPDGVTRIGKYAFGNCYGITDNLVIPDSVITIGDSAFRSCYNLTSTLVIPDSVTNIGSDAFKGCSGLTGIIFDNCSTSIGAYTFSDCYGITNINLGNSVTSIGTFAFSNCYNISGKIVIPDSTTSIGSSAFANCYEITSVDIGDGVTSIGGSAFKYCDGITSVDIGKSVTSIGSSAFNDCYNLKEVHFMGDAPSVSSASGISRSFPASTKLYYPNGASGWTTPTWKGYTTICCSHKFTNNVISRPTCTLEGKESRSCSICHYSEEIPIKALGHTEINDKAVAPTCTETGLTEGSHCSVCGEVIVDQYEVEALGHSYGDWVGNTSGHWQACSTCKKTSKLQPHHDENADTFCETCGQKMSYVANSLALSHEYLLLAAGETAQLVAIVDPAHLAGIIDWSSSDESIFRISEDGLVTAVAAGTAFAKASLEDEDGNIFEASCRIDVVGEELENLTVHAGSDTATSNIYSTNYPEIEVIFDLSQNMIGLMAEGEKAVEDGGNTISEAYFADAATADMFALQVLDDRTLAVIPIVDVTDATALKVLKSSYKSAIVVVVDGAELVTPEVVTIKVDKKLPTVKATAVKFNSFYTGQTLPLIFDSKSGEVVAVELGTNPKGEACPEWLMLNDDNTVTLANGVAKASGKLFIDAYVEGYSQPVAVTVSVSAAVTAPKVKLSSSKLTFNAIRNNATANAVSLLSSDKKVAFEDLGITNVFMPDYSSMIAKDQKTYAAQQNYQVTGYDAETGMITINSAHPVKGKILLACEVEGSDTLISLSLSVEVYTKAPTLKLSPTSVTMNPNLAMEDDAAVGVVITPADLVVEDISDFTVEIVDGKKNVANNALDVAYTDGKISVATNANTIPGESYKVNLMLEGMAKPASLAVKTVAAAKSDIKLTIAAKGKLVTTDPGAEVVITPKWTNFGGSVDLSENFKVYGTLKNEFTNEDFTECFDIWANGDGTYSLKVKDLDAMANLHPKATYNLALEDVVVGSSAVPAPKPVKLSLTLTKAKVEQSAKAVTLYPNDRFSTAVVELKLKDNSLPAIAAVEAIVDAKKPSAYEATYLGNGKVEISFMNNQLTTKDGSVKLNVYLEGNDSKHTQPNATVTVSVKLAKFKNK